MENLLFSLNVTMPILFLMIIGYIFNKINVIDDSFANKLNKFVFEIAIPLQLFKELSVSEFTEIWDGKYLFYCFFVSALSVLILFLVSFTQKDKSIRAEFIQGGFRSSAALVGTVFVQNAYGESNAVSLMILGSIPLYNIMSVIILIALHPENSQTNREILINALKGIVKNPIIIGITLGITCALLGIPQPIMVRKTIVSLSATATPLGLMALGASLKLDEVFSRIKPTLLAASFRLVILCSIFLPIGILLGFRDDKLIAALAMLGGAATVSCFTMAKNMNYEGHLSSGIVIITTLFSTFTLTGWLFILKMFNYI